MPSQNFSSLKKGLQPYLLQSTTKRPDHCPNARFIRCIQFGTSEKMNTPRTPHTFRGDTHDYLCVLVPACLYISRRACFHVYDGQNHIISYAPSAFTMATCTVTILNPGRHSGRVARAIGKSNVSSTLPCGTPYVSCRDELGLISTFPRGVRSARKVLRYAVARPQTLMSIRRSKRIVGKCVKALLYVCKFDVRPL